MIIEKSIVFLRIITFTKNFKLFKRIGLEYLIGVK